MNLLKYYDLSIKLFYIDIIGKLGTVTCILHFGIVYINVFKLKLSFRFHLSFSFNFDYKF